MHFTTSTLVILLVGPVSAFVSNSFGVVRVSTTLNASHRSKRRHKYVPIIPLSRMPGRGGITYGDIAGHRLCIAVSHDGLVHAFDDKCPPVNNPLSSGKISGYTIEDPVLGTTFDLKTGEVHEWCPGKLGVFVGGMFEPKGVPVYPVRAKGKHLEVGIDAAPKDHQRNLIPDDAKVLPPEH